MCSSHAHVHCAALRATGAAGAASPVATLRRLHQILEPFVMRRQVHEVEGTLPEKVAITIKCPMTPYQSAIYQWVNATALLRVDPQDPGAVRRGCVWRNLKNKVMEMRKARENSSAA